MGFPAQDHRHDIGGSASPLHRDVMESQGWIKLHRKFLQWEWYKTPNMVHFFVHLLISANREDNSWQGIKVNRGQLITGIKSLSANTGISAQSVRTCIERLKSTHEITIQSTNKYSIINICNYEHYQDSIPIINNQNNNQINKQLTNNQQTTNNKQEYKKEENKEKEEEKENFSIITNPEKEKEIKNFNARLLAGEFEPKEDNNLPEM